MFEIMHKLIIKSNKETIFKAISTEEGITKWWTGDCEIDDRSAKFHFNNRSVSIIADITENTSGEKLIWKFVDGFEYWLGTQVEFTLSESKSGILVTFIHSGWKSTDGDFGYCSFDWAKYLLWMRTYCQTGEVAQHLRGTGTQE